MNGFGGGLYALFHRDSPTPARLPAWPGTWMTVGTGELEWQGAARRFAHGRHGGEQVNRVAVAADLQALQPCVSRAAIQKRQQPFCRLKAE